MSLAGKNALAHYEQSRGHDQISHTLSNIHGFTGAAVIFLSLDVISVYSVKSERRHCSLINRSAQDFKLANGCVKEILKSESLKVRHHRGANTLVYM